MNPSVSFLKSASGGSFKSLFSFPLSITFSFTAMIRSRRTNISPVSSPSPTRARWPPLIISYTYILHFYCSFPFWRALVRNMTNRLFLYLICLQIFFVGFIPVLSFLIYKGSAEINWFLNPVLVVSGPTFYFLIGYWIENVLPESWVALPTQTAA